MTLEDIDDYLLSFEGAFKDRSLGENLDVYKVPGGENGKMFALVKVGSSPINISLRCDTKLAVMLRERYESVMAGDNLNPKQWNTILLTGQLTDDEIKDLIRHSYVITTS